MGNNSRAPYQQRPGLSLRACAYPPTSTSDRPAPPTTTRAQPRRQRQRPAARRPVSRRPASSTIPLCRPRGFPPTKLIPPTANNKPLRASFQQETAAPRRWIPAKSRKPGRRNAGPSPECALERRKRQNVWASHRIWNTTLDVFRHCRPFCRVANDSRVDFRNRQPRRCPAVYSSSDNFFRTHKCRLYFASHLLVQVRSREHRSATYNSLQLLLALGPDFAPADDSDYVRRHTSPHLASTHPPTKGRQAIAALTPYRFAKLLNNTPPRLLPPFF